MSPAWNGGRLVAWICAGGGIAACAADPGDAPKGDDSGSVPLQDGSFAPGDSGAGSEEGTMIDSYGSSTDGGDAFAPDAASPAEASPPDAGGHDGAVTADAPLDVSPDVAVCTSCPLVVQYATSVTTPTTKDIAPHFQIVNNGASAQDLSVITLRYWYTAEGSQSQAFACDYTALSGGCGALQATFSAAAKPTSTADHYMELSFTGGSIPAGSSTGEIQTRFHDTGYAVSFTQGHDYSFNAADASYTPWDHVTLYRSGTLVWGVEPQ
jgi:hypothetical protein